jgi:predicted nucleotidyltransferase
VRINQSFCNKKEKEMGQLNSPKKIQNILEDFVNRLKDAYKDGFVSLILYGSAASGEFTAGHSNIDLLVILKDTSLENLAKIVKMVNAPKFRIFNPIFFTEEYIGSSIDVFPIEFLDMKENHSLIYGKDVLKNLNIDMRNLRFQCEHELKAILINIKRLYLNNRAKNAISALMFKSFTSGMHLLRNILRLKGKTPPYAKEELIKELERELELDEAIFRRVYSLKKGNIRLTYKEVEDLFFSLAEELEKAVNIIDRL